MILIDKFNLVRDLYFCYHPGLFNLILLLHFKVKIKILWEWFFLAISSALALDKSRFGSRDRFHRRQPWSGYPHHLAQSSGKSFEGTIRSFPPIQEIDTKYVE